MALLISLLLILCFGVEADCQPQLTDYFLFGLVVYSQKHLGCRGQTAVIKIVCFVTLVFIYLSLTISWLD